MTRTFSAVQLVAQAETQAQIALRVLRTVQPSPDAPAGREQDERALARLKVQFLFPQLPAWQHSCVTSLYWQRQALERLLNHPPKECPTALRVQTEQVTRKLEHTFTGLVRELTALHRSQPLSVLQQEVLARDYLHVRFADSPVATQP